MVAELIDAEHLIETGDMTKQTLSLGEKSTGTRRGDPGHYDIDSALVNADGTIETAMQTYRPRATELKQVIGEINDKVWQQLRASPAGEKILTVHVDDSLKRILQAKHDELGELAQKAQVSIEIVSPNGARLRYAGGGQ
ncbi:MAG: hypothetical protein R3F43_00095 [bacterium]